MANTNPAQRIRDWGLAVTGLVIVGIVALMILGAVVLERNSRRDKIQHQRDLMFICEHEGHTKEYCEAKVRLDTW